MSNKQREKLAAACHESWSHWMEHLFRQCKTDASGDVIIPKSSVRRWKRQIKTPYSELSDAEQESDRSEADRMLQAIEN